MINNQHSGSNFRVADIFLYDEIITDVPVTDADPFAVKVSVNTALLDEASGVGNVILLSPMKNPLTEEFPVAEILLQEDLLNRFGGENSLKGKTSPFRTMLGKPMIEESCLRPSDSNGNSMDETIKHEHLIILMIEPLAALLHYGEPELYYMRWSEIQCGSSGE